MLLYPYYMFLPDDILLTSNIHLIVVFIISLWFLSISFFRSAGAGKSLRISVFFLKNGFLSPPFWSLHMSLSTISRFNYTLILYLWLYRFICQVYAHPRPKVGLQVFAFIFYIPPLDTWCESFITRARHPIRKTRFFVPPRTYSLRI